MVVAVPTPVGEMDAVDVEDEFRKIVIHELAHILTRHRL
jgi:predicted SprT family Zn-dependent metalloprotease